jgi:hypothetical protein
MTVQQKVHVPVWLTLILCSAILTLGEMVRHALADPPAPPPGLAAPRQPTPMPDFSLPAVGGTSVRAADLQGKVIVVRFWATW